MVIAIGILIVAAIAGVLLLSSSWFAGHYVDRAVSSALSEDEGQSTPQPMCPICGAGYTMLGPVYPPSEVGTKWVAKCENGHHWHPLLTDNPLAFRIDPYCQTCAEMQRSLT